jgi:hypothetical protein
MRIRSRRVSSAAVRLAFVAGLCAAAGSSPAFAQDQETWRCSADNGRYDQYPEEVSPKVRFLTGRIQFNGGDYGEHWNPTAHIAFTDSALPMNGDCFCNGIRASMYRAQPGVVKFFLIANGRSVGIAQAPVGIPITFRLSIDSQGVMTAVIGKTSPRAQSAKLAHPRRDMVHMSCSSGDVSFLNVRAG